MKIQSINKVKHQKKFEIKSSTISPHITKTSINELRNNQVSFNGLFEGVKIRLKAQENKKDASLILEKSKEYQKQASEITQKSQTLQEISKSVLRKSTRAYSDIKTAMELAKRSGAAAEINPKNDECIRVYKQEGNNFVMREYIEGILLRKAILTDNRLIITDLSPKSSNRYIFNTNTSELLEYSVGIQTSAVGYKTDRKYSFKNYKLTSYDENYHTKPNAYESSQEHYVFKDGVLSMCYMDYHDDFDGFKKAQSVFEFKKDKLVSYTNGLREVKDAVGQKDEVFSFFEENLCHYSQDLKQLNDGTNEADKIYAFHNGKLINAKFGFYLSPKGEEKSDEVFYYNPDTGKFREYVKK
ncbi:MAG: hypothetical protein IKL52_05795 [Candidatus Gastranaerophilales bacterium]|nr:hypothetical protein [Candidatus Gastranaerophilales bacterium]